MNTANKPFHYIQFPLSLLGQVLKEPHKTLNKMLCYGLLRYAKGRKQKEDIVVKQLFYDYYHDSHKTSSRLLPGELFNMMCENDISYEEYNGFRDGKFEPDIDEIKSIKEIILHDKYLMSLAIEHFKKYNIKDALKILNYKVDVEYIIEIAENVNNKDKVLVSANIDVLNNYLNQNNSEFELLQFMANSGIRSILGKKSHWKTNNKHILARMFGYKTHQLLIDAGFDENPIYIKYSTRHHIKKLIDLLKLNWGFLFYSDNVRGHFVGMKNKISLFNLIKIVEENKTKNRIKRMEQQEKAIRLEAKKKLGY